MGQKLSNFIEKKEESFVDGMKCIKIYRYGELFSESWYKKDVNEAEYKYKEIIYDSSDSNFAKKERWYNNQEKLDREDDLPAVIKYYENGNKGLESWLKNGVLHRNSSELKDGVATDLPAFITYDRNGRKIEEVWFKDGRCEKIINYKYESRVVSCNNIVSSVVKCKTKVWKAD